MAPNLLERAIKSVVFSGLRDIEHIVMDGGSTDESLQIIERHVTNLTKVVSEKDNGQYDAISKGFAMATGDILCWLNSDDIYFPWTMRVVARIFVDFPQIDWIMGVRCELRDGRSARNLKCDAISPRRDSLWSISSARARLHHAGRLLLASKSLRKGGRHLCEMAGSRRLRALDQVCRARRFGGN